MVLERDSSILGYPGEISQALAADHHGVCKYDGPQDPSYIVVRNFLKTLVSKIISENKPEKPDALSRNVLRDMKRLLALSELPGVDYILFRDKWTQGTNDWIFRDRVFLEWRNAPKSTHSLLWLSGGPATGKSVMSSFIVNKLVQDGFGCQYFFIRFDDQKKRTVSLLLRSLAYQLALAVPGFLQKIVELADEAIDFERADPGIIWDRIFKLILFNWEERRPLYWIIDGLDEADDPRLVIKLLWDISSSSVPIRILFAGRRTSETIDAFKRLPHNFSLGTITIEGHMEDINQYIRRELVVAGNAKFRSEVGQRIAESSRSNFLVSH